MPPATSFDKSLTQRSESTINRNNDSAGEDSSREIARTAVDIGSLSATLEAIDFYLDAQEGVTSESPRRKGPGPEQIDLHQTSFDCVAS